MNREREWTQGSAKHRLKINGIKDFSKAFLPQNNFWISAKIQTIKRSVVAMPYFVKFSRCKLFLANLPFLLMLQRHLSVYQLYLKIIMLHNSICRSFKPQSSKVWFESRRATVPYRDYIWRETKLKRNESNIMKINQSFKLKMYLFFLLVREEWLNILLFLLFSIYITFLYRKNNRTNLETSFKAKDIQHKLIDSIFLILFPRKKSCYFGYLFI